MGAMPTMTDLLAAAEHIQPEVVALRRDIHAHPELGLDNPRTQRAILDALDGLGLDISLGAGLTSVVAELDTGRPGPTVLLRADTDALPMPEDTDEAFRSTVDGAAHACGHDGHTAMLAGAARLLAGHRGEFTGRVRFMFQPGEEGAGGARLMVDQGVLAGVDRAFAIHVTPNIPAGWVSTKAGPIMASADDLAVTVTGKGGHASTPHFCVDPIPPMCAMVGAFQTMITRELDAFQPALVSITHIEAGTTNNVIPESAWFEGTIRAVSEWSRLRVHESIPRVAASIAAAHNCTVDVQIQHGYPVTVNDPHQCSLVGTTARGLLGDDRFFELPHPVMGAEDFSYVLQGVPGCMALLGVCPADIENSLTAPPCHSNRMRLNEDALATGVALHLAMVMPSG